MESAKSDIGYFEINTLSSGEPLEKIMWTGLKGASDDTCKVLCCLCFESWNSFFNYVLKGSEAKSTWAQQLESTSHPQNCVSQCHYGDWDGPMESCTRWLANMRKQLCVVAVSGSATGVVMRSVPKYFRKVLFDHNGTSHLCFLTSC